MNGPSELLVVASIVMRVAEMDPLTRSDEGLDDGCFFCGARTRVVNDGLHDWDNAATHAVPCLWVAARLLAGLELGLHDVEGMA